MQAMQASCQERGAVTPTEALILRLPGSSGGRSCRAGGGERGQGELPAARADDSR